MNPRVHGPSVPLEVPLTAPTPISPPPAVHAAPPPVKTAMASDLTVNNVEVVRLLEEAHRQRQQLAAIQRHPGPFSGPSSAMRHPPEQWVNGANRCGPPLFLSRVCS